MTAESALIIYHKTFKLLLSLMSVKKRFSSFIEKIGNKNKHFLIWHVIFFIESPLDKKYEWESAESNKKFYLFKTDLKFEYRLQN